MAFLRLFKQSKIIGVSIIWELIKPLRLQKGYPYKGLTANWRAYCSNGHGIFNTLFFQLVLWCRKRWNGKQHK